MDSVSTSVANAIPINVTSIVSVNSDDKNIRYKMDYFILHTFLLVTILLLFMIIAKIYNRRHIIAIICYRYTSHKSK